MRKDEYTLTKELRRLEKYGFLLQAKRVGYVENYGYKYNILFTEDKRVLEPECSLEEVMGIINSLDTCLQIFIDNRDQYEKIGSVEKHDNHASAKNEGKAELTEEGRALFEELRKLRLQFARSENVPPYIIFNDKALVDMCIKLPSGKYEMLNVFGVGKSKCEKYGEAFLSRIAEFIGKNPDVETWN